MNITQVLDKINRIKPNSLSLTDMIEVIEELELDIAANIVSEAVVLPFNLNTTLLAPDLFSRIYFEFLSAKIDFINGNIESYSLTSQQFNSTYEDMKRHCIKTGITPLNNYKRTDYF